MLIYRVSYHRPSSPWNLPKNGSPFTVKFINSFRFLVEEWGYISAYVHTIKDGTNERAGKITAELTKPKLLRRRESRRFCTKGTSKWMNIEEEVEEEDAAVPFN